MKKVIVIALLALVGYLVYQNYTQQQRVVEVQNQIAELSAQGGTSEPTQIPDNSFEYTGEAETNQVPENFELVSNFSVSTPDQVEGEVEVASSGDNSSQEVVEGDDATMNISVPYPNDSTDDFTDVVFVDLEVPQSEAVLTAVYTQLFSGTTPTGNTNRVPGSGLTFESVSVSDGIALVKTTGQFMFQELADAVFRAQVNAAALQFDTVEIVMVENNGALFDWCIADQSDGESGCSDTPQFWIDTE